MGFTASTQPPLKPINPMIKYCGFCGKDSSKDNPVITGPVCGVCGECIDLLSNMIKRERSD